MRSVFYNRTSLSQTEARLAALGIGKDDDAEDAVNPVGIANKACNVVLLARQKDGSNQLGTDIGGTAANFSDTTNYMSHNDAQPVASRHNCAELRNVRSWVPLRVPTATNTTVVQPWLLPHWGYVKPYAITSDTNYIAPPPPSPNTQSNTSFYISMQQVIDFQASLNDEEKITAEFWADGPGSFSPPGHWFDITRELCRSRSLSLDSCVRVLYLQANAVLDAGIATWLTKRIYDTVRPISAIQCLRASDVLMGWRGPYQGVGPINGSDWVPYQSPTFVTPPFAEYTSGHSCFSMSSARVLQLFFGSDVFNYTYTIPAGASLFEPRIDQGSPGYIANVTDVPNTGYNTVGYVPANNITLSYPTFSSAAYAAGISRLYGGIHFDFGNVEGLRLGRKVADAVFARFSSQVRPSASSSELSVTEGASSHSYVKDAFIGSLIGVTVVNVGLIVLVVAIYHVCFSRSRAGASSKTPAAQPMPLATGPSSMKPDPASSASNLANEVEMGKAI